MRLLIIIFIFLFSGCGDKVQQPWRDSSISSYEAYKRSFLRGDKVGVRFNYEATKKEAKSSLHLATLLRLYLAEYGLEMASLNYDFENEQIDKILNLEPDPKLKAYFSFLNGDFSINKDLLPKKYQKLVGYIKDNKLDKLAPTIKGMKDPVSAIISTSITLHYVHKSKPLYQEAIERISFYGYKGLISKWTQSYIEYLKSINDNEEIKIYKNKLELIQSDSE